MFGFISFALHKSELQEELENFAYKTPDEHARYYQTLFSTNLHYTVAELQTALQSLTLDDLLNFLSSSFLKQAFVEGYISGDIEPQIAILRI